MSIARWSPFRELARMREEMDRLFDEFFGPIRERRIPLFEWTPAADILEDEDELVIRMELPGMKKENLSISLRENHLTGKANVLSKVP
jgi:HSP20 family protein